MHERKRKYKHFFSFLFPFPFFLFFCFDSLLKSSPSPVGVHAISTLKTVPGDSRDISRIIVMLIFSLPCVGGIKGAVIRWVLQWIVPRARRAVGEREKGKSVAVQIYNQFKRAYAHLAKLLESEGVLHDPELLFYFSHYELRHLVRHQRVRLSVHTATQRRAASQFYQHFSMNPLSLGESVPVCVTLCDPIASSSSSSDRPLKLSGMPVRSHFHFSIVNCSRLSFSFIFFLFQVSPGVVIGRVCVINSVSDASQIKKGDILIAPYTDVGWTVYFALLSGLVTELGGIFVFEFQF